MRSFPLSFYLCSTQRTGMWGSVSQSNLQYFLTVLLVLIVEWGCCGTSVLKQPLFFRGINLPIYFKYFCGNVVDVSTLTRTMKELKAYNIDTKFAVLDAGYLYCWASKPPATVDEIELLAKSRNIKTSYSSFLTLSNTTKVLLITDWGVGEHRLRGFIRHETEGWDNLRILLL